MYYYCPECDQLYEIHDEPVRRCEDCGSKLEPAIEGSNREYEAGYAYACGYYD